MIRTAKEHPCFFVYGRTHRKQNNRKEELCMQYRKLGRTGLQVSEIGLGCEGFVLKDDAFAEEIFRTALESGVNCMDLYTPNPDVHRRVGRAIQGRRGGVCAAGAPVHHLGKRPVPRHTGPGGGPRLL